MSIAAWFKRTLRSSYPSSQNQKHPPLHWAAYEGDIAEVRRLLDSGTDVNSRTSWFDGGLKFDQSTALHLAARAGMLEVVRLLLERGANVDDEDSFGQTPLFYSMVHGNEDVVVLLMDAKATLEGGSYLGLTPLQLATVNGFSKIVQRLLNAGAAASSITLTALGFATLVADRKVVEVLLDAKPTEDDVFISFSLATLRGKGGKGIAAELLKRLNSMQQETHGDDSLNA